ncbi:hypothetical protein HWV62_14058 [Athelia sp. TMB]|nr:hypothetical protein HWV62_14058 [Athelia sp. TMB]
MKFKTQPKPDQKLTSFFTRKTPSSSQPQSSPAQALPPSAGIGGPSSSPAASSTTLQSSVSSKTKPKADLEVISVSSNSTNRSHISISSDSVVLLPSAPKPKARLAAKSDMLPPQRKTGRVASHLDLPGSSSAPIATLKRSRSPSVQLLRSSQVANTQSTSTQVPQTPTTKRKKKFEANSNQSFDDSIIVVSPQRKPIHSRRVPSITNISSSPSRTSIRKPSPPKRVHRPEDEEVLTVPSSQSDEQELAVPAPVRKSTHDIKASVHRWREGASADPSASENWNMDVDVDLDIPMAVDDDIDIPDVPSSDGDMLSSPSLSHYSEAEVMADLEHSADTSTTPTTPASPMPGLAGQIHLGSPLPTDSHPAETSVALDQASKTAQLIARIKAEAAKSAMASSPEGKPITFEEFGELDDSSSEGEEGERNPKRPDKGKGKSMDVPMEEYNPFGPEDGLPSLDRKAIHSAGTSSPEAESLASGSHQTHPSKRTRTTVKRELHLITKPTIKPIKPKAAAKKTINPLDSLLKEKWLAEKLGKGANALRLAELSMDAKMETFEEDDFMDEEAARRVVDASVMEGSSADGLADDDATSTFMENMGLTDGDRVKKIFEKDRAQKAAPKVVKVLGVALWDHTPGSSDVESRVQFPAVTNPTLGMLIKAWGSNGNKDLASGELAFRLLSNLWNQPFPETDGLSTCISTALARLGASADVLSKMGWHTPSAVNEYKYASDRAVVVHRLVQLARMSAKSGALILQDAPDAILALLLVAMDPFSQDDLKFDVTLAVSDICLSLKGDQTTIAATELEISAKILRFAKGMTPINQAQLMSIISSGSGRVTYLAMWIAHGLLVDEEPSAMMHDDHLPPLANIIRILSPAPGSGDLFDIHTRADLVDYEDLGYYIDIISVALSKIHQYVIEERRGANAAHVGGNALGSPSKSAGKLTDIERIEIATMEIHGKIVDTRAAHLERSRAKASIHRLSLRIYYQRLATEKSLKRGGKMKIVDFFMPKS